MHPRPRRSARTSNSRPRSVAAGREAKPWWSTAVRQSLSSSSGRSREASNVPRTVSAAPRPAIGDEREASPVSRLFCHASDPFRARPAFGVGRVSWIPPAHPLCTESRHPPRSQRDARVGRGAGGLGGGRERLRRSRCLMCCGLSETQAGGRGHHRSPSCADGSDDLLGVDALKVDRCGPEVCMAELALDDVQRYALPGELDRMSMT